ncbi:MAG: DUF1559 domain-containing protein [Planctomycetia bacterium]|nr:DUF1559 domain-containing protein [Planctomycetia bacterium]
MTKKNGFTLVELLVVIAIIGMLVGLLLPAVQQAREAARQMQCNNNMKQMAMGAMNSEATVGCYPSAGWSYLYVGEPDRGVGAGQPGGWTYSLLPYVEQNALYMLPATGGDPSSGSTLNNKGKATQMCRTPLKMFYCPSRRKAKLYKVPNQSSKNLNATGESAKTDYAGCIGPAGIRGGLDLPFETVKNYRDTDEDGRGLFFPASQLAAKDVYDGTSNTYLLGEKYLNPNTYTAGTEDGDDNTMFGGKDKDFVRTAVQTPKQDRKGLGASSFSYGFGSPHAGALGMAMADGSVHRVSYTINLQVHQYLSNRMDEQVFTRPF